MHECCGTCVEAVASPRVEIGVGELVLGGFARAQVQSEEADSALEVARLVEDEGERRHGGADEDNLVAFFPGVHVMEARRVGKVEPPQARLGARIARENAKARDLLLVAQNGGLVVEELLGTKQGSELARDSSRTGKIQNGHQ